MATILAEEQRGIAGPPVNRSGSESEIDPTNAAKYGMPPAWFDTVLTGAGAGFVFGPAGALVGGLLGHLVGSMRRDRFNRHYAMDQAWGGELDKLVSDNLGTLLGNAKTDHERAEVQLLQREARAMSNGMKSANPQIRAGAFDQMRELADQIGIELDEMEQGMIEREDREREIFGENITRADNIRDDVMKESQTFIATQRGFDNLMTLLEGEPTELDANTAIFEFARLVNPGEIITEGDIGALSAGGGLTQAMAARLNDIALGRAYFDETILGEMREAAKGYMRNQLEEQTERNAIALDRGRAQKIPEPLLRNVPVPITFDRSRLVPEPIPGQPLPGALPPTDEQGRPPIMNDLQSMGDTIRDYLGLDPNEQLYINPANDDILRRVDYGGGRFGWERVEQPREWRDTLPQVLRDRLRQYDARSGARPTN